MQQMEVCGWCDMPAKELTHPHMFDPAFGKKMCKACWDHDREVYKGSMGQDIGEFQPIDDGKDALPWTRYRFTTGNISNPSPQVFNPNYPWWYISCEEDRATMVAFLPSTEDLHAHWPDADEVEYDEWEAIRFTESLSKPDWYTDKPYVETQPVLFFQFTDSEGVYIMVAVDGRQAINHFFNEYQDKAIIDDELKYGGVRIHQLTEEELNIKHSMHDHELGHSREVTYKEVYKEGIDAVPSVIVSPTV